MRLPTANALSVHDNVHVYAEDCIAKRGTDPVTKKQVLTHCCAATGSIVGVSEFSFGLFSYFSSPSGIYRRAFVSRVRLYQVYIFSCIFRTQQRLVELARMWCTTLATRKRVCICPICQDSWFFHAHTYIIISYDPAYCMLYSTK